MTVEGAEYYAALGAYFGAEAELLDELDASNPIHRYIRRESIATLDATFQTPGKLLEIGFGTGHEAVHLAKRGFQVVGFDPSQAMGERARLRAKREGVSDLTEFRLGSTADVKALAESVPSGSFAGAYSTLGPLNCEPDLEGLARALGHLISPDGAVVATVLNRNCAWEMLLYSSAGKFKKAFRRQVRGWADLNVDGTTLPVIAYTPHAFAQVFAPIFEVERQFSLPAFLPPPYAAKQFAKIGSLLDVLESADMRLRGTWPFCGAGDHFEVVMRRRASDAKPK